MRNKPVIPLAWAILLILQPALSWARAGDGGNFSGGGGGGFGGGGGGGFGGGGGWGGGGGGGGGGSFTPGSLLIVLIVFALILLYNYVMYHVRDDYQKHTIAQAASLSSRANEETAVDQLKSIDPTFDAAAFYKRVNDAFFKIQNAWCAHKLDSIRPFVSDGIFERFSLEIAEQHDMGVRDQMDNLRVLGISLDNVDNAAQFDVATLRVAATASDYKVSLANGAPVQGRSADESFVEYWTFIRKRGVKSRNTAGLMEGNCPNCGAAIQMNQAAICSHCNALLRSGEYDWVLAEITQESEYHRTRSSSVPGEADMTIIDPGFNVTHLEDRASVIFWRKLMADRLANVDCLRKVSTDEFVNDYKAGMDTSPNRSYYGQCGVGSVDARRIIVTPNGHTVVMEIHWSGSQFTIGNHGNPIKGYASSVIRSIYVLSRKSSARTDAGQAVSSAHCPNCGAAERIETSNACAYCHTVLNDGSLDWVLTDIHPFASPEAQGLLAATVGTRAGPAVLIPPVQAPTAPASAVNLIAWMIKLAMADGTISPEEQRVFTAAAARRGVTRDQVASMMNAAASHSLETPEPANGDEAREWLSAMALSAMADGILHPTEQALLRQAADALHYSAFDLDQLIRRARTDLYAAAVAQLKGRET